VEESRVAAACALATLRDAASLPTIRLLRERTDPPLRAELDHALSVYAQKAAPSALTRAEATARLRGGRTPPLETRPVTPGSSRPTALAPDPPLLPTSHVSVPHAEGSREPATRRKSRPPETAPEVKPGVGETARTPPPPTRPSDEPADLFDSVSGYRK